MNEQALKSRLKQIATEQNRSFQEVWKLLLLERFLVRLSRSQYADKLIFKGGLLLSYYLAIVRETTDIDLLARRLQAEITQIQTVLTEICGVKIEDNIELGFESIDELDHTHMNYPGYRVKIRAQYGNMKDRIQVDIGVGDAVEPVEIQWPLFRYRQQPLFEDAISLQVYPVETIFAEKLETIMARGAANSRMKDFHDLVLLCRNPMLTDKNKLNSSIGDTFLNRGTDFAIPITFSENEYRRLQVLWDAHLRTLDEAARQVLQLPTEIFAVIQEINTWLNNVNVEESKSIEYVESSL